tara:strand:- start:2481 stop:3134 length:654 start_codon:yes stop_codon:yes gene_type:complete
MKLKLSVPDSLADITLRQYKAYEKVLETNKDIENADRFINLKMLEIFCNISYKEATSIRVSDYNELVIHLHNVLKQQPKLVLRFKMGDSEFGFIPDLEEITFGEYIDLDTNIHDISNIHKAMAVLYRPIKQKQGKKYIIHEYKGDLFHEAMLDMPMDAVVSSNVFFYNLGIDLSNVMMNSFNKNNLSEQALLDLERSGVGSNLFMPFVTETSQDLRL